MNIRKYQPTALHPLEALFNDRPRTGTGWWPGGQEQDGKLAPSVDIEEKEDCYVVHADLPGVSKDDIQVSVDDGILNIAASCETEDKQEDEGQFLRRERYRGSYMRRMSLGGNIDESAIEAGFSDGVLELKIPRMAPRKPEALTIKVK